MMIRFIFTLFICVIGISVNAQTNKFNILDNTSITVSGGTIDGATLGGITPLTGITINSANTLQWGTDTILQRDATNTLALYNGTNAQSFNVYNTRTDVNNYERGFIRWGANQLRIGTEASGTGSAREIWFYLGGTAQLVMQVGGGFYPPSGTPAMGSANNRFGSIYQNGIQPNNATVVATPTTGQTITVAQTTNLQVAAPSSAIAALTIQFPTPLADGHKFELAITQSITSLTLTPAGGATIVGGPSTTTGATSMEWRYNALNTSWYNIGAGSSSLSATGAGLSVSSGTVSSNANEHFSYQPGLITAIINTKSVFGKFSKASTVDNIEGSANTFTCASNPTITMYECGTSATCATPTTIGSVTVTAAGQAFDGAASNPAITAGDYVAWAISAGTCTSLDISATAQVHAN